LSETFKIMANIKKKQIYDLLSQGRRLDGRGLTDYREIKIETGIIDKALGSALVSLGKTKVVVGIKVETGKPFPDKPDEGVLITNAEFVPLASPDFEPGPPSMESIELARVVDRGIRESKAIDTEKLCIVPETSVFLVFVDIYVLDYDGNLFDTSALASMLALLTAKMQDYIVKENGNLEFKDELINLPIMDYPIEVTIAKIGDKLVVDPSLEEELSLDAQITIALTKNDEICAIQKSNLGTFNYEEVADAVKIAKKKARELREKFLKGYIANE